MPRCELAISSYLLYYPQIDIDMESKLKVLSIQRTGYTILIIQELDVISTRVRREKIVWLISSLQCGRSNQLGNIFYSSPTPRGHVEDILHGNLYPRYSAAVLPSSFLSLIFSIAVHLGYIYDDCIYFFHVLSILLSFPEPPSTWPLRVLRACLIRITHHCPPESIIFR